VVLMEQEAGSRVMFNYERLGADLGMMAGEVELEVMENGSDWELHIAHWSVRGATSVLSRHPDGDPSYLFVPTPDGIKAELVNLRDPGGIRKLRGTLRRIDPATGEFVESD